MMIVRGAWGSVGKILRPTLSGRDLYSVLNPVTRFCQIAGIFPLALKGPVGMRKYSKSYISIIYSVTILALTLAGLFAWTAHTNERIAALSEHAIVRISIHMELSVEIQSLVVMIVAAIINKDKFANAIDTLSSQDVMLRKLGTTLNYTLDSRRSYIRLGIIILIFAALIIFDFIYQLEFNLMYPSNWLAWMCPHLIRIASTCLFVDVIFLLRQRFATLNEHLKKMITETENSSLETISRPQEISERIRLIARIHGDLCEVARSVNQTFGLNVIIGVVYALLILITMTYYIIKETELSYHSYLHLFGSLNWGVISSGHIIYIVTACHLAQNQANLTGKLIHKFRIQGSDTPLISVIQSFSLQLHHEKIEFSAAGLFPLDATLIQSIVGAVTTYIVILIQFDTTETPRTSLHGANDSLT